MDEQRPWHRLFGLSWTDFFRGRPVTVDPERDLSVKKQLLDVLLIRKEAELVDCRLPDGFEDLVAYNLVTFKSYQEKLSAWTLEELIGHYVNLRKQVSPSMDEADLLPREDFRLFAVSARYPRNLAADNVPMRPIKPGVYEVEALSRSIRLVVVNQLPEEEHNALLHLFSANGKLFAYGARHYRIRSEETSSLLFKLFQRYQEEIETMPDALEEFTRETIDEILKNLPARKRLEGLSADDLLAALSPQQREALARQLKSKPPSHRNDRGRHDGQCQCQEEIETMPDALEEFTRETIDEILKNLPAKKRLEGISAKKRLEGLSAGEVLAALSPQQREALARQLKSKPRRRNRNDAERGKP